MRHLLISIFLLGCSDLDRSNPYDPINAREETAELTLSLPLGKTLASVIHRVEAVITSPTTPTILKQLDITPLGPATGTISTLQPGGGYTLTLRGYDIADQLIFEGQQSDITIGNNDTTLVEFQLTLLVPLPDIDTEPSGQTDGDAPGEGDADGATEPATGTEPNAGTSEDAAGTDAEDDTTTEEKDATTDTGTAEEDAATDTGTGEESAEETG